ncbi:helix-turn-helix domain-containing protein [Actinosynnema sp. NPDC020468]|uniref:TetR/AcrR family transcriptional regulator n=1 Tax=Actinosynnema sp. NPDC020468 TaxID=3154488 RepID=UPI00340595D2
MPSHEAARTKPLRADARRNRTKVLETAREAFATDGPSVSIDEIARRAGVGAGTVHRHFPTKESLLQAVLQEHIIGIVAEAKEISRTGEPGTAFFELLSLLVRHGMRNKALADSLAGVDQAGFEDRIAVAKRELYGELESLMRRAQQERVVRSDLTLEELHALLAGIHLAMRRDDEKLVERLLLITADGLRHHADVDAVQV